MMWAIFCSLAFCTFQAVFANKFEKDIFASQFNTAQPMVEVHTKAAADITAAANAVKVKEMWWDEILERCTSTDFGRRFENIFQTKYPKCSQCYNEAKNTKDIETAENCCKKLIDEFKKDAKVYTDQVKTCIAKCAQDGSKCRKELINIKKREDKTYLKVLEGDNKNV